MSRIYIQQYECWWSLSRSEFLGLANVAIESGHYSLSPYKRVNRPRVARRLIQDDEPPWMGRNVICPLSFEGDEWRQKWIEAAMELGFTPLGLCKEGQSVEVLGKLHTITNKQGAIVFLKDEEGWTTWCPGIILVEGEK